MTASVAIPQKIYFAADDSNLNLTPKRMVREARDFGETLQEQVNMTHRHFYEDSV
jgi:hypothetical protein